MEGMGGEIVCRYRIFERVFAPETSEGQSGTL